MSKSEEMGRGRGHKCLQLDQEKDLGQLTSMHPRKGKDPAPGFPKGNNTESDCIQPQCHRGLEKGPKPGSHRGKVRAVLVPPAHMCRNRQRFNIQLKYTVRGWRNTSKHVMDKALGAVV